MSGMDQLFILKTVFNSKITRISENKHSYKCKYTYKKLIL